MNNRILGKSNLVVILLAGLVSGCACNGEKKDNEYKNIQDYVPKLILIEGTKANPIIYKIEGTDIYFYTNKLRYEEDLKKGDPRALNAVPLANF